MGTHFYQAKGVMSEAVASLDAAFPGAFVAPRPMQEEPSIAAKAFKIRKSHGKRIDWVETGSNLGAQYVIPSRPLLQNIVI